MSVFEPSEYCVLSRSDEGMFQAIKKLVELGHRRIACNIGPLLYLTHRLRMKGLQRAIQECSLEIPEEWIAIMDTHALAENAYRWGHSMLTAPNRPTAIVVAGGGQAIQQCATELGLKIPQDLSLISWASAATRAGSHPHMAVVDQDLAVTMRHALDMLMNRIEGREMDTKTCWVTPDLVVDESMAPAPQPS